MIHNRILGNPRCTEPDWTTSYLSCHTVRESRYAKGFLVCGFTFDNLQRGRYKLCVI